MRFSIWQLLLFLLLFPILAAAEAGSSSNLTEEQAAAEQIFASPPPFSSVVTSAAVPGTELLDPYDPDRQKQYIAGLRAEIERFVALKAPDEHDLAAFMTAAAPMLRYLEGQVRLGEADSITVPPQKSIALQIEAFCLDTDAPAPNKADGLHLAPMSRHELAQGATLT